MGMITHETKKSYQWDDAVHIRVILKLEGENLYTTFTGKITGGPWYTGSGEYDSEYQIQIFIGSKSILLRRNVKQIEPVLENDHA